MPSDPNLELPLARVDHSQLFHVVIASRRIAVKAKTPMTSSLLTVIITDRFSGCMEQSVS